MRKVILYLIPVLTLVAFVLFMNAGSYLKKPMGDDDDVVRYIELVKEDIKNENWESAVLNLEKLDSAWRKIVPRIQYSVERDEVNRLSLSIDRINGAIMAMDKAEALVVLSELTNYWNSIGN